MTTTPVEKRAFVVTGPVGDENGASRIRSKANAVRSLLPLLMPRTRAVAYLGWVGHTNLGDEAIYEACRRRLSSQRLIALPRDRSLARIEALAPGGAFAGGLLGGGTLVGYDGYLNAVGRLRTRCPTVPQFGLGLGVLDPRFHYGSTAPDLDELLPRWVKLLRGFDRVTVRGPRSQEILAAFGLEVPVVGDTALLLADDQPGLPGAEGLLGLNVGISRSIWGADPVGVLGEVVRFARALTGRGWRIRLVPMWPADLPYVDEAAARIGPGAEVFDRFFHLDQTLDAIRECRVFVGLKLHSVVLASAVHVPSLMLEYQPKCADFQASIGRSDRTFRTDRLNADELVEHVEGMAANYATERKVQADAVLELRCRLGRETSAIEQVLRTP